MTQNFWWVCPRCPVIERTSHYVRDMHHEHVDKLTGVLYIRLRAFFTLDTAQKARIET